MGQSPAIIASVGEDAMLVQTIEIVELGTGDRFGGVIRVVNTDAVGRDNMYWFAPGIGMIMELDPETGELIIELVEYTLP